MPLLSLSIAIAEESSWTRVEGGIWRPADHILSKIKMSLEPYMRSREKRFGRPLKKWRTYRFQYQGQEEKGRKFVFINAFCDLHDLHGINLSKNFVLVHDGGGCFFQLKYDPIEDEFFDAFINGEA